MRFLNENIPPVALSIIGLLCCFLPGALFAEVEYDQKNPQLAFAAQELEAALKESGSQISVTLSVELDEQSPDAFELKINGSEVLVVGTDASGAMYGGLEVAECLKLGLPIVNKVLFKAISKTKPGRHHAVLKKGVLTVYTGCGPGIKRIIRTGSMVAPKKADPSILALAEIRRLSVLPRKMERLMSFGGASRFGIIKR